VNVRFQVSTDAGAIGIWDPGFTRDSSLETQAKRGESAIIRMGGDVGGVAEVYVDKDIPEHRVAESVAVTEQHTVVVRSGALLIDGIEHFGQAFRAALELPNGTYRVTVRETRSDDDLPEPDVEKELRRELGAKEVEWYDRTTLRGLLGSLATLLLFPVLLAFTRWYVALPVTVVVFVGYFHALQWVLKRNPRYQRLQDRIGSRRLSEERPLLLIRFERS
jgi:hypothetical protein